MPLPDPDEARSWRTGLAVINVGFVMATAVALGYWLGHTADEKLGTDPWLMALGLALGSAVGFVHLIRVVNRASDD
jgi:F0F1-type ATP synthase assembly protein I